MTWKKLFCIISVITVAVITGCQTEVLQKNETHRELIIYSDLQTDFVNALTERFVQERHVGIKVMKLDKLDGEKTQADVVLSNSVVLNELAQAGSLNNLEFSAVYNVHHRFRGHNNTWVGIFYDPVVLLIDRSYSRKYGQVHLHSWNDLRNTTNPRIVVENFNNSEFERQLFAAFASNMGEEKAFKYFLDLDKYVIQYTKFPFTPVRLLAAGEADFAITLSSYVYEYLDNDFPAYTVEPSEGTPIILYGAGVFKGSDSLSEATQFVNWLLTSNSVQTVTKQKEIGFKQLASKNINVDKLWLNNRYTNDEEMEMLIKKWYDKVRFGNKKW